jgi:S1-C subfamily serine protease
MRAAFGLAGILVTLGVIVWLMGGSGGSLDQAQQSLEAKKKAETVLSPLSGRNQDGGRITDTVSFEAQYNGGKFSSLLVASIEPGNALATYAGLAQYDLITKVNGMPVRDIVGGEEMAKAQVLESAGRRWTLTVARGNGEVTLPLSGSEKTAQQPAGQPGQSQSTPPPPAGNSLQRQLENIQKVPSH